MPDPQITVAPQPPVTVTADAAAAPQPEQTPLPSSLPAAPVQNGPVTSNPAPSQQAPHPVKAALHGWQALMGSSTQYVQTPNGPQPVQVQNKPGQLFRSILAGAIMGGAAGAEHNDGSGAGYGGAGRGAQAVIDNDRQQLQMRQQQGQQQFQNTLSANKDRREQSAAETEELVRKAQIAQANAETLRTNLLTQGASFDLHQKVADADKDRVATYTQAGVKPVFEDIPESQMQDVMKNRPGASALDWRHTGVKTVVDANGNPSYEYTLSAYDPTQPLPLAKATIDQWDKDGLFKYHPEYKDIAQPGKTLTVGQFIALDRQSQQLFGQNLARNKAQLENDHLAAQINEVKAATSEHYSQAALANLGIKEKKQALADKAVLDTAWAHLAAVGNDPSKLTDPKDRIALAKGVAPVLTEVGTAIKTAEANSATDKDAAASLPGLWGQYNTLTRLATLGNPTGGAATPISVTFNGQTGVFDSQAQADAFIAAHPGATVAGAKTAAPSAPLIQGPSGNSVLSSIGRGGAKILNKIGSTTAADDAQTPGLDDPLRYAASHK